MEQAVKEDDVDDEGRNKAHSEGEDAEPIGGRAGFGNRHGSLRFAAAEGLEELRCDRESVHAGSVYEERHFERVYLWWAVQ